ncbi:MAG TPA: N-acetylmuramic acid 6-phosphate etherase [Myxococcaceae bacterium]|nr:N-acetylmuramic acid 6-phosphate etherase [Myxococcaceae bacterium]
MSRRTAEPTERLHPAAEQLDLEPIAEIVRRLGAEDLRAVRAVGRERAAVARLAQAAFSALTAGGRLIYVGAGTSGRLGALDAAECPPTFGTEPGRVVAVIAGGPAALRASVEGAEDDPRAGARAVTRLRLKRRDLVCGVSASARTPFVLGALGAARRAGARTALVCCNRQARVPVDLRLALSTGPELVAGSTRLKAGTATKCVLNAVSTATMVALGHVYRGRMVDVAATNAKLRERAVRMVAELAEVSMTQARLLLAAAGGHPSTALAMHFTGLQAADAARLRRLKGLRTLERLAPR